MRCGEIRDKLGPYVDDEVSPAVRSAIAAHVCECNHCRGEIERLQDLGERIKAGGPGGPPQALWGRIEARLLEGPEPQRAGRVARGRRILAMAACVMLAVGSGYLLLTQGVGSRVEAATVDFSVLLDGLSVDPEAAFREFVNLHRGRPVAAGQALRHASQLNFGMPSELPGGFVLETAFALQIGEAPAAAATYRRGTEFIGTVFHRAIHIEDYGTHRDHPCVIGEHRGHQVQVGEWRLVHVTDATTCHCVLSRLDDTTELPPVLRAVAPGFQPRTDHSHP